MKLIDLVDDFLNEITTYRLLTYGLSLLAVLSITFSFIGKLSLSTSGLGWSLAILLIVCVSTEYVMSKVWRSTPNQESWLVTALILFFILPQANSTLKVMGIATAGLVAIASKYILSLHNKHVFNPAAFGAFVVGLIGVLHATWWIGSMTLWPYVLVLGLLILRKINLLTIFMFFVAVSLVVGATAAQMHGQLAAPILKTLVLSSPLIFLGSVMLTEPATMPSKRRDYLTFALIVGFLYSLNARILGQYIYPETALVAGNIFAYLMTPMHNPNLVLKEVQIMSHRVHNYVFTAQHKIMFEPGQYMSWTLPGVSFDGRGNRRTFTIASSPTENEVMMGVKLYEPSSTYKQKLQALKPGDQISSGQIGGSFTMPKDASQKLLFIAGGVGITPFRSMLKYSIDQKQNRDIVLLYIVSDPHEVSYGDILQLAVDNGIKVLPILTSQNVTSWKGIYGPLSTEILNKHVKDLEKRIVYIAGSNQMVKNTKKLLHHSGVRKSQIKTDYFSGY